MKSFRSIRVGVVVCALVAAVRAERAFATGVPIGGFLPMVGIGLTDEFDDDLNTFPTATNGVGGTLLGAGGAPLYDVALLDTGAAVSLLTRQAYINFGMNVASPGEPDGYRGTETIAIGGATGTLLADINDPHGLYASGLQHRTAAAPLAMNDALLQGQTNTSTITLPAESDLPNVLGLSYASQYATYIRSDQPQIFTLNGKTVRTPSVEFLPLGSGGQGIVRRAPLSLNPSASFQQPPSWLYNIDNFDINAPHENPSLPTVISGGLFLNVNLANSGSALNNASFFFDTGADVSVLSELTALQLGIDVALDEPDFTVAVIGSGGAKADVPGYYLDQFTIQAIGGSVVANNVPVIVLDVADPSNPANIVPGIVGTNLLAGRNVVIDPNPSLGGGGSPSLFISDPVTTNSNWVSPVEASAWSSAGNWSGAGVPGTLNVTNLRNTIPFGHQRAVLNSSETVWELNVSGAPSRSMVLAVDENGKLTTFSGVNIEGFGVIELNGGSLDAQFVEILFAGTLTGNGSVYTGSGPIAGQVENRGGSVSPGVAGVGTMNISGRFANGSDGSIVIGIGGTIGGSDYSRLIVDGPVTLDGTLNVIPRLLPGGTFVPSLGDVYSVITASEISGEFATLNLPALAANNKMWQVTYDATAVLLKVTIPGDFDGDFTVDGDDLAVWREDFGGLYSGVDFLTWQRNLGMSVAPIAAVPEPTGIALGAIAFVGIALWRRPGGSLSRG
jgi:hypothetical protein